MSPARPRPRAASTERGAALLAVLWFVAAVSALAVAFTRTAVGDRSIVVTQADSVRARAMARDGLARAMAYLNTLPVDRPLPRSVSWSLPEGRVTARVEVEDGKVDLNAADRTLLAALGRAVEVPADRADEVADAIVDWRDGDDLRQPRGAERREYGSADRPYAPANRPFRQLEELRYVLPVDNAVYARLVPYLTIYSGQAQPDRQRALPLVRAALDLQRGLKPTDREKRDAAAATAAGAPPARSGLGSAPAAPGGSSAGGLGSAGGPGGGRAPAGPTGTPQPRPGGDGGGAGGLPAGAGKVYTLSLDVRLAEGYESHARAVVALAAGDGGGRAALRILDWTAALPVAPPAEQ